MEIDKDGRLSGRRIAVREIEVAELLELALDPIGHLVDHLVDRGAWPVRLDDHRLDGEGRVFFTAKVLIGQNPTDQRCEHQVPHERPMLERPFGQVESGHWLASKILTVWPGDKLWTPAVTTRSPAARPPLTVIVPVLLPLSFTSRSATVRVRGSTTHTIDLPSRSSSAVTGRSIRGAVSAVRVTSTVVPNRNTSGG